MPTNATAIHCDDGLTVIYYCTDAYRMRPYRDDTMIKTLFDVTRDAIAFHIATERLIDRRANAWAGSWALTDDWNEELDDAFKT